MLWMLGKDAGDRCCLELEKETKSAFALLVGINILKGCRFFSRFLSLAEFALDSVGESQEPPYFSFFSFSLGLSFLTYLPEEDSGLEDTL